MSEGVTASEEDEVFQELALEHITKASAQKSTGLIFWFCSILAVLGCLSYSVANFLNQCLSSCGVWTSENPWITLKKPIKISNLVLVTSLWRACRLEEVDTL